MLRSLDYCTRILDYKDTWVPNSVWQDYWIQGFIIALIFSFMKSWRWEVLVLHDRNLYYKDLWLQRILIERILDYKDPQLHGFLPMAILDCKNVWLQGFLITRVLGFLIIKALDCEDSDNISWLQGSLITRAKDILDHIIHVLLIIHRCLLTTIQQFVNCLFIGHQLIFWLHGIMKTLNCCRKIPRHRRIWQRQTGSCFPFIRVNIFEH
jgi:hypothetical protein